jgi:hypothetical protein
MYGAQVFIGEAFLVSEDTKLAEDITSLNEKLYRTKSGWVEISVEKADKIMEDLKRQAINLIGRMIEDIKNRTRFEIKDLRF